jgi:glucosamine-6-phosphate deaminase
MGSTFARLVEQRHEAHIGYETSGSIAVLNAYFSEMLDTVGSIADALAGDHHDIDERYNDVVNLKENDRQPPGVLRTKAKIREIEAASACRFVGAPGESALLPSSFL